MQYGNIRVVTEVKRKTLIITVGLKELSWQWKLKGRLLGPLHTLSPEDIPHMQMLTSERQRDNRDSDY